MEVVGFLALAALVVKVVAVLKSLVGPDRDMNLVVTQVLVWGVGTAVLLVAREAAAFSGSTIPGLDLVIGDLDTASLVLAGLILGSSASFGWDALVNRGSNEPDLTRLQ